MHNSNLKTGKKKQIGQDMRVARYITAITLALVIHGMALSYAAHKKEIKTSLEQTNNALQVRVFQLTKPSEELKEPIKAVKKTPSKKNKQVATDSKEITKKPKKEIAKKQKNKQTKTTLNKNKTPIKDNKAPLTKTKVAPQKSPSNTESDPSIERPSELVETTKKQEKKTEKKQQSSAAMASPSKPKLVEKPKFSAKPTPVNYPKLARKRGWEGQVLVEVWINAKGQQTKQIIIHSAGHKMLDQAALKAIKHWQFSSSLENQVAVAHRVRIPVNFQLK